MTPTEINAAIAEIVGARFFTEDGGAFWHFVTKDGRAFGPPTEDLNAIHEAEKTLSVGDGFWQPGGFGAYRTQLAMLTHAPITAEAWQRCEAFLRAHGKWRD